MQLVSLNQITLIVWEIDRGQTLQVKRINLLQDKVLARVARDSQTIFRGQTFHNISLSLVKMAT